jgi:hypothetical protein
VADFWQNEVIGSVLIGGQERLIGMPGDLGAFSKNNQLVS